MRKHRPFPRPFERIALSGRSQLVGVEVGVLRGDHALSLLRHADIRRLYLVDPYLPYTDFNEREMRQAKRVALSRDCPTFHWLMTDSVTAAGIVREDLDFVYLDGRHDEVSVLDDIEVWWPLIKAGGVLGGHDIYNGECAEHDGVVTAVAKLAVEKRVQVYIESPDWWAFKP